MLDLISVFFHAVLNSTGIMFRVTVTLETRSNCVLSNNSNKFKWQTLQDQQRSFSCSQEDNEWLHKWKKLEISNKSWHTTKTQISWTQLTSCWVEGWSDRPILNILEYSTFVQPHATNSAVFLCLGLRSAVNCILHQRTWKAISASVAGLRLKRSSGDSWLSVI